jgi:hypothetical protein
MAVSAEIPIVMRSDVSAGQKVHVSVTPASGRKTGVWGCFDRISSKNGF